MGQGPGEEIVHKWFSISHQTLGLLDVTLAVGPVGVMCGAGPGARGGVGSQVPLTR